jgi:pyridoxamine 5'-phosphate oxidase
MDADDLRREYEAGALSEESLAADPLEQFRLWFHEATDAGLYLPDAMTLATAGADGAPNARTVVLRGFGPEGFLFYTSYGSAKARELDANPRATLLFHWHRLERQVRLRGAVARIPREQSEAYFAKRPRGSQVGAWASPQSEVIESREALEARARKVEMEYVEGEIPAPPDWGGYCLRPETLEFWQGRPNRLHDRFLYTRTTEGWRIDRLGP